ncbi:M28 family metallopeptidase [Agrilutibacter solisilvae]|uniref:M28 family peptidase n=1 Tax=Agrilutibacter solisilvae TaxID=2763317 RepID=A0A974XZX9_9GAMM|nr:M28 family metallopeptidase [Lysobacter solisilvae]QSX78857.1 M28 family peptidase [Lysobacter solisilvae]
MKPSSKRLPLAASLLALAIAAALPLAHAADAPTFDPQRLSEKVKVLSSDEFLGRGPAEEGETKTVAYLIEQMKAAGLQPGGDLKDGQRAWTQAVPLLRAQITGQPTISVNRDGKARPLAQGDDVAVRAALNGQKHVAIQDAPLVFVGYGVKAPERNWDDFKGVDLKGKVAVVLINDPDFERSDVETYKGDFGGKAMTYYGRWTYKFEEAARQGAAGLLIVHETAPASYGWATVKNSNTNTMFDVVRENPAGSHPALEGWIQYDVAADLFKQAGLDLAALKKQAQTREFKPVELKGATFTADYDVDAKVITSQNVVGRVEGRKRPDEHVVYSAHWDHLGVGQPDAKGDTIYNGAVDNATGTAALLELGRAFAEAKPRPERSLLFLAVTAEEKGLLGSEYYASSPLYPLGKTVGVINMDGFSPWGPARNFSISGSARLELLDRLIATASKWNLAFTSDTRPEAGSFFRSDHFPFAKRGVPAISYGTGNDLVDGGVEAGKKIQETYTAQRYHQPADQWEASWPFTGLARDLSILYTLGDELANSKAWPNWSEDSEFRGARDASADDRR